MKIIVGLGNPGDKYKNTRHNLGFLFVDYLVKELKIENPFFLKHNALICRFFFNDEEVMICKPQTFMNSSGDFLLEIKNFYKLENTDFLVIHDELNLSCGSFKFSFFRSDGGHNGVKSIIKAFSSKDFLKLRIGIGTSNVKSIRDFVLEDFKIEEINSIKKSFPFLSIAVKDFLLGIPINKLMNSYN